MQGVFARDVPVVRAVVPVIGSAFIVLNLGVDLSFRSSRTAALATAIAEVGDDSE
jgi:hypothetical protein